MTTTTTTPSREVEVAFATNDSGDVRLTAECADELTEMVMTNYAAMPMFGPVETLAAQLTGDLGSSLVQDHLSQCASCQADAATVGGAVRLEFRR